MGVQWQEELPVRKARGKLVRGVYRESRLADPGHAADGVDAHHPASSLHAGWRPHQLGQFGLATGEGGDTPGQGPGHRGLKGC